MALTKRSTKGSALTYAELDGNFTHLGGDGSYVFPATDGTANYILKTDGNGQISWAPPSAGGGGINLTDLSVGSNASASGTGGIGYDNTTGVFTYTPPDLSSYLTSVAFSAITSKPTTIAGYGITEALQLGTSSTTAIAGNTTFAFADITSKPTTIAGYGITDALQLGTTSTTALAGNTALLQIGTSSTTAMAGNTTFAIQDLSNVSINSPAGTQVLRYNGTNWINSSDNSISLSSLSVVTQAATSNGSLTYNNTSGVFTFTPPELAFSNLSGNVDLGSQVSGTLPVANMAATALTTVQTAANESAQLALTTQEGDVVVRTDQNKTYMRNSGTAGTMADFTLLATPTDAVTSVDGNTGAVTTLQLGTTSTTALAGNTPLLQLGTTSTTALAGNTSLLQIGTSSTTAMAGDTTFALQDLSNVTISSPANTQVLRYNGSGWVNSSDNSIGFSSLSVATAQTASGVGGLQYNNQSGVFTFTPPDFADKIELTDLSATTNLYPGSGGSVTYDNTTGVITYQPQYNLYGPNASTVQDIGLAGQTGNLNVGISTASHTVNIAGGSTAGGNTNTVNIASTGSVGSTQTVNIARLSATGVTTNVNIGNTSSSATSNIDLTGNVSMNAVLNSNTMTIGSASQTGTITIGRSTDNQTIAIAEGDTAGSKTTTVKIANTGDSGSTRAVKIASNSDGASTVTVDIGNPNTSSASAVTLNGDNISIQSGLSGDGAPEYFDFYDYEGGYNNSGSDMDWDISGTGLNALTQIDIPLPTGRNGQGKRQSLRMSCQSSFYNSSSSTKRTAAYYLGLQIKSKGTSAQSENIGAVTYIGSPSMYNGQWSFAGNVTDKIVAGFGMLGNSASASGMSGGGALITKVLYDASANKTYIRVSSYSHYRSLGGSNLNAGDTTSFDVYYNPTDFQPTGSWVSGIRADQYNARIRFTVQPQSTHQMHHSFNISLPKETSTTSVRLIFQYQGANTDLAAAVYNIEGTAMIEGSRV